MKIKDKVSARGGCGIMSIRKEVRDNLLLKGNVRLRVWKEGILIEESVDHNMIVNGARLNMSHLVAGDTGDRYITTIALGTSGTAPQVNDTTITNAFTKAVSGIEYPASGQVRFKWVITADEANGKAIIEFGLLCADGTLFARYVREGAINKASDLVIEGEWTIEF
jgi:hypothetical protein